MFGMSVMDVLLVAGTMGFLVFMPIALLAWTMKKASAERAEDQSAGPS